ncbi:hypothetical protein [Devosia sp.]|uniref:hypothetical protein n=1 Tax=Devosia sp. TaxID=1871048 RepID=UPI003F724B4C
MLIAARQQREEVKADLEQAANEQRKVKTELHKRSRSLFRLFYKKRIAALHDEAADIEDEIGRLEAWDETTHVDMTFETTDAAQRAYAAYPGVRRVALQRGRLGRDLGPGYQSDSGADHRDPDN